MSREANAISVLVRTFNSEKTLPRLLSALDLQSDDEIIAVDSGSTDGTLAVAEKFGAHIFNAPPPFNYSKSLNIGFQASQNSWVLVISSHAIPLVPNLLSILRTAAAKFPPDVVAGYGTNSIDLRQLEIDCQTIYYSAVDLPAVLSQCGNANAIYRHAAWEAYAFDETLRTGEDHHWLANRAEQGFRFARIPAARTLNRNAYSLRYMFRKGFSEVSAHPHSPMTLHEAALIVGTLTKSLLFRGTSLSSYLRLMAHAGGRYAGSRRDLNNYH